MDADAPRKSTSSETSIGSPRRGSTGLFASLSDHKRPGDNHQVVARRQSLHDQKPATGFIGTMWHNWTQGGAKK